MLLRVLRIFSSSSADFVAASVMKRCLCDAVVRHQTVPHLQPRIHVVCPSPRPTVFLATTPAPHTRLRVFPADELCLPIDVENMSAHWRGKHSSPSLPFCPPAEAVLPECSHCYPQQLSRSQKWETSVNWRPVLPSTLQDAATKFTSDHARHFFKLLWQL